MNVLVEAKTVSSRRQFSVQACRWHSGRLVPGHLPKPFHPDRVTERVAERKSTLRGAGIKGQGHDFRRRCLAANVDLDLGSR